MEFLIKSENSQVKIIVKLTILIKFQITNPIRVCIEPSCGSLNELLAAKLNTILGYKCTASVARDFVGYWGWIALCKPYFDRIYDLKAGNVALAAF